VTAPRLVLLLLPLSAWSFVAPRASATPVPPWGLRSVAWRPVLEGHEFSPVGGDLSVTVSARAERSDHGSELAGFVALAVPLDRLAAPRKLTESAPDAPKQEAEAPEAAPHPRTPEAEPAKEKPDAGEPREEPALPAAVLARLARDAVRAALRAHDVASNRSELEGLGRRARFSAALPELRLRAVGSNDQSQRLTPTIEDPERYTVTSGNDLLLEASATWKLNRLVFADEEIAIERLELEREKGVAKLSERVVERLFDWHRAFSCLSNTEPTSKLHGRCELERLEAEVELDVLTGGWFGEAARHYQAPRRSRSDYKSDESTSSSRTSSSSMSTLPTPSQ
jgi:hypothetical protein